MAQDIQTDGEKKKRGGQVTGVQMIFAAIVGLGLFIAVSFSDRITAGQPLQAARVGVEQEIENLQRVQATLIVERDFVNSDAYVEQWARNEGKMLREGERLVIPVPSGVSIEPTPAQQFVVPVDTSPPQPEPWELWWALFFDGAPPEI